MASAPYYAALMETSGYSRPAHGTSLVKQIRSLQSAAVGLACPAGPCSYSGAWGMRIAVGGVLHETSTFLPQRTSVRDFEQGFGLFRGDEVRKRFAGANMCI